VTFNPFANDEANAAYFEDERRLLGPDDPSAHGYGERLRAAADLERKRERENAEEDNDE